MRLGETQRVKTLSVALAASVLLCAPGCKVVGYFFPSDQIELGSGDATGFDAPEPIDSVSTRGLEVRLWVVDDTDWTAPRLLASLMDHEQTGGQTGEQANEVISEADRKQWAQWGMRLLAIPVNEIDGLLAGLRPVQPINVQWLGEFGKWRAIVRAGELKSDRVRVGAGSVKIEQGRPRLIARSWIEPVFVENDIVPGVRLDLGLQIQTMDRKAIDRMHNQGLLGSGGERTIEDAGPIFDELLISMLLDGSHALGIVGDAPEMDWDQLPDPVLFNELEENTDEPKFDQAFGPGEQRADGGALNGSTAAARTDRASSAGRQINEPRRPIEKTIGELMLTSPGSRVVQAEQSRRIPKRVIVVLIPRIDGGFWLVPGASSMSGVKDSTKGVQGITR